MRTTHIAAAIAIALASLGAASQSMERMQRGSPPMDEGRSRMPMKPDYAKALDISPEKAAQVEAAMQREREQMRKLRESTRAELAKILTPDQLARLEQLMPRGPRPPMGDDRRPMPQGQPKLQ